MNTKLKLSFIKRLLTGCVTNNDIVKNFYESGDYPDDQTMTHICNQPIPTNRIEGMDWPENGLTMIGMKRMDNLENMLDYVRENQIEGDLVETGVWKGGATIFMKLYCDLYNIDKKVFVCDSFEGLPKPSGKFSADYGDRHHTFTQLAISLETVKNNFKLFHVLDENVVFIKGFFSQTLPNNNLIGKVSLLRMDGDMYESTHDVFYSLYHKLNSKGVLIVDDYCLDGCKQCVIDFRSSNNINETINVIDRCGIYWIKN